MVIGKHLLAYRRPFRLGGKASLSQIVPLIALPVMTIWSLFDWVQPSGRDWILLIMTGVFTQIGQVYMTKALQTERAAKVSSLKYLGTVYALVYRYIFFAEFYSFMSILGILLVITGVLFNLIIKGKEQR